MRKQGSVFGMGAAVAILVAVGLAVTACGSPREVAVAQDACAGVSDADLSRVDPHRGATSRLVEDVGKQRIRTVRGVRHVLPAEPGLGAASARRLTACRIARSGVVPGEGAPVVVRARELGDGIEVTIASEDVDVARAIVRSEGGG